MQYDLVRLNRLAFPTAENEDNDLETRWCGYCFKPIVTDPDSDLWDGLTLDLICHCRGVRWDAAR